MMRAGLVVVTIVLLLGAVAFLPERDSANLSAFPSLKDATLAGRTIVDFGIGEEGTVAYSYLADQVPERLAEDEVPELRSENSYTRFIEVVENGEDPILKLETRFYSQPAYAQDVDGSWRYLEYATTTEQAFRNRDLTLWKALTELVVRTAYADSISPFSTAGDGHTGHSEIIATWGVCTGGAGNISDDTSTSGQIHGYRTTTGEGLCEIFRFFMPFNTGSIPSNSTISAATLNVYAVTKSIGDDDGIDYVTVTISDQASTATLGDTDYPNVGSEAIDSGSRIDISSNLTTGAYNSFSLNSTGLSNISAAGESGCASTNGWTCFALREGHDFAGSAMGNGLTNDATFRTSEQSGTSQDPYLEVTYTVGSTAVQSGMKVGSNGSLKVTSGGIKIK